MLEIPFLFCFVQFLPIYSCWVFYFGFSVSLIFFLLLLLPLPACINCVALLFNPCLFIRRFYTSPWTNASNTLHSHLSQLFSPHEHEKFQKPIMVSSVTHCSFIIHQWIKPHSYRASQKLYFLILSFFLSHSNIL